jgi:hypothetical protein
MTDFQLVEKIANSWNSALLEECRERLGPEEGDVAYIAAICGGVWYAMSNIGAEQTGASLNALLSSTGIGWQLVRVS